MPLKFAYLTSLDEKAKADFNEFRLCIIDLDVITLALTLQICHKDMLLVHIILDGKRPVLDLLWQ